jgi:hypothetical protein
MATRACLASSSVCCQETFWLPVCLRNCDGLSTAQQGKLGKSGFHLLPSGSTAPNFPFKFKCIPAGLERCYSAGTAVSTTRTHLKMHQHIDSAWPAFLAASHP